MNLRRNRGLLKITDLATEAGTNRSYVSRAINGNSFYKAFAKSMGMSPSERVARNR